MNNNVSKDDWRLTFGMAINPDLTNLLGPERYSLNNLSFSNIVLLHVECKTSG